MKIIAGEWKGRRLETPRGPETRPTADQVRIALMDTLTPHLPGARLLDLFCGAGGVGLEALSRGAAHVTFVERHRHAVAALQRNIARLGAEARTQVLALDVARALDRLAAAGAVFDLVYLDPPYDSDAAPTLQTLAAGRITTPTTILIAQHFTKRAPPSALGALRAYRSRRFGETTLTFFRAAD